MTTPQHTPGPWRVRDTGTPLGREIIDSEGVSIAYHTYGSDKEALSNGHLIAAAPAMLAALRALVRIMDTETVVSRGHLEYHQACRAIADAEGGA